MTQKSKKKISPVDSKQQNNPNYMLKVSILNSQPLKIDSRTVRVLTMDDDVQYGGTPILSV